MNRATLFDFDKVAPVYDDFYQSDWGRKINDLEKLLIGLLLNEFTTKNVLEIGCGTGNWSNFFAGDGFKVTGIDISERMIDIAKSKNIKNAEFIVADACNLPFEDESVDNIMAFATLEFIKDRNKTIKEMHRVLKKNGLVMIGALNKSSQWYQDNKKDALYSTANFFDYDSLYTAMSNFGSPNIQSCVFIEDGKLLDEDPKYQGNREKGGFLVGISQKMFL